MRASEERLRAAAEEILRSLGEEEPGASLAAAALVGADLRGVSTHGVNLLRLVSERVRAGMLALPTRVELLSDEGATALLDGGNGLGPVAAERAFRLCVEKARSHGVGMVCLRNTNNLGALGYFTEKFAGRDRVLALLMTNGNASVAPFGAAEPFVGTNPISLALPAAGGGAVVLDMSSSVVARGKIRLASLQGQPIPAGWALDEEGRPTEDPKRALAGSLLPLGGPKGSGLAILVDLIAGLLSGSAYGRGLKSFHELEGPTGVGACFIAADPGRFMEPARFDTLMEGYAAELKSLRRQPGFEEILLPGELEARRAEEGLREGVELPDAVAAAIDGILAGLGSESRLGKPGRGGAAA